MGSGMLPAGAYVTLEHEYILILRKGPKREFNSDAEKKMRRESAIFWEERNHWYSDVWFDIKGTVQTLKDKADRKRSAAFPFSLVYRLVNMYSVKNDTVLDPFLGTGTTMAAAMAAGRNSVGYDRDKSLKTAITKTAENIIPLAGEVIANRLGSHLEFVARRLEDKGPLKHINAPYGFPVITAQEKALVLDTPLAMSKKRGPVFEVRYETAAKPEFCRDWATLFQEETALEIPKTLAEKPNKHQGLKQGTLF